MEKMNKINFKHIEARMFSPLFKTALMLISVLSLMSFSFGKKIPKGTYNATFEIKEGSKTSDIKMDKVTTKISVKVNGDTSDEVAKMLEQEIQNIASEAESQALKMFLPSKFEFTDNTMITFLGIGITDTCAIRYISNDKFLAGADTVKYQFKDKETIYLTCKGVVFTLHKAK